jgi:hypothetical protein
MSAAPPSIMGKPPSCHLSVGIEELRIGDLARPAEDPLVCPRASQVTKIAEIIDSEWLVHIRGTPASGKLYWPPPLLVLSKHWHPMYTFGWVAENEPQ